MGYLHASLSVIRHVAGQHPIDPSALILVCHVSWLHWQDSSIHDAMQCLRSLGLTSSFCQFIAVDFSDTWQTGALRRLHPVAHVGRATVNVEVKCG